MPGRMTSAPTASLTPRERDILRLMAEDLSNAEIAERLVVSPHTVKWYVKEIYSKLGVHSRDEALALADGLVDSTPELAQPELHRLPALVTSLVGRSREIAAVRALLRDPAIRLITLLGTPGIGKTRLSLEVAHRHNPDFPDGIVFVALASLTDPALVGDAMLNALGLEPGGAAPAAERLKVFLRNRRLLLVADNFEHLLPAAPLVGDLLAEAPGLKVLATSREPLRVYGEREFAVPPLDPASEAVALFEARAQAVWPEFAVNEHNAVTITAICKRLDGLPLAIELAAARMKMYTPHALLGRLANRLSTLTGGARDLAPRHQTLRAAIAWSYDLLTADEQRMFARFSVFEGGASLEAFAEVCGYGLALDPLDGLESLVGKSLIQQAVREDGEPRLTMYEALREFAAERLAESGEEEATRIAHTRYYLPLGTQCADQVRLPGEFEAFTRFAAEYPNIREAWLCAAGQPDDAKMLAAAYAFKHIFGVWAWTREGLALYEAALKHHRGSGTLTEANLLIGWAFFHSTYEGRMAGEDVDAVHEAMAICERLKRPDHLPDALINLAGAAFDRGDFDEVERLVEAYGKLGAEYHQQPFVDISRTNKAYLRIVWGDLQGAREQYEAILADIRPRQLPSLIAGILSNLALLDLNAGDLTRARVWAQELAVIAAESRQPVHWFHLHSQLSAIAFLDGDWEETYRQGLLMRAAAEDIGQEMRFSFSEGTLAASAARQGHTELARQHLATALMRAHLFPPFDVHELLCSTAPYVAFCVGKPTLATEFAAFSLCLESILSGYHAFGLAPLLAELEAELGPEAYSAAWARGEAMDVNTALALARQIAVE